MYFLIVSTIINVVMDILFVCVIPMGVMGAALATVIAQFISVILCGIYAYKKNPYFKITREDIAISFKMVFNVVRLGVPMSLQFGLIAVSSMALQFVVNGFGTTAITAFTATNRIEQFIHQPYMTLAASLATFSGQNYGAKGLKITSLFYLSLGLIYVVCGVLTGLGDAFFALFNGIIEVIGRFTIPFLITSYLGYGEAGIWLASGFVWLLSGVTAWIRYKAYFRSKVSLPSREIKIHVPAKHKIHKGSFRLLPQKFHH